MFRYDRRLSTLIFGFLMLIAGLAFTSKPALSQGQTQPLAKPQPAPGLLTEMMGDMTRVQKQLVSLEQAMPREKMTWRPGEGVRSVSEVYMHIAFSNYQIGIGAGFVPPAGVETDGKKADKWESSTTDKVKIAEELNKSSEFLKSGMLTLKEADLDKKISVWGTTLSVRALLMIALTHQHEHLGQAIAYARMNGVTPPWTAARLEKSKPAPKPE